MIEVDERDMTEEEIIQKWRNECRDVFCDIKAKLLLNKLRARKNE